MLVQKLNWKLVKRSNFMKIITIVLSLFSFCLISAAPVYADLNHFIDSDRVRANQRGCDVAQTQRASRCMRIDPPQGEKKCTITSLKEYSACSKATYENALNYDALPQPAKNLVDKIFQKKEAGLERCDAKFNRCFNQCMKRAGDDAEAHDACLENSQCHQDFFECAENVFLKHSIKRSKKLERMLKGQRP